MKSLELVVKNIVKIVNKNNLIGGKLNAKKINTNLGDFKDYLSKVDIILKTNDKNKRKLLIKKMKGGNDGINIDDLQKVIKKLDEYNSLKETYLSEIKKVGSENINTIGDYMFLAHLLENSENGALFTIGFDSLETYLRTLETSLTLMDPILDLGGDMALSVLNSGISTALPGAGAAISISTRPAQKILLKIVKHNIKRFPILFIILLNINRRRFSEAIVDLYEVIPFVDDLVLHSANTVKLFNNGVEMSNKYIEFSNLLGKTFMPDISEYNKIIK